MKSNVFTALVLASSALLISPNSERVLAHNFSPAEQLVAVSNVAPIIDDAGKIGKAALVGVGAGVASDNSLLLWGGVAVAVIGGGVYFALKG